MKLMIVFAVGVAGVSTAACSATIHGHRVDTALIAKVVPCQTSKAEAFEILGAPCRTGSMGNLELMTYEYGGVDRVQVASRNDRIVDVAFNVDDGYRPWDRCLAPR